MDTRPVRNSCDRNACSTLDAATGTEAFRLLPLFRQRTIYNLLTTS
jgi:hypothetical protein